MIPIISQLSLDKNGIYESAVFEPKISGDDYPLLINASTVKGRLIL